MIRDRMMTSAVMVVFLAVSVAEGSLRDSMKLVPESANAFVIVENLKQASNEIEQCMERMEKSELLVGGRPIDMLKAAVGFSSGINENGSLILYISNLDDGGIPYTILVPVKSAEEFIQANLDAVEQPGANRYMMKNGELVDIHELEGHVAVMSPGTTFVQPGDGIMGRIDALGSAVDGILEDADCMLWIDDTGMRELASDEDGRNMADLLDSMLIGVRLDPLGMGMRCLASMNKNSPYAELARGGSSTRPALLDRLPAKPFYFAMSMDMDGMGGIEPFKAMLEMSGLNLDEGVGNLVNQVDRIRTVQLGVYPSKLGIATGGLLNDASLVLGSDDSTETISRLRSQIEGAAGTRDGIKWETKWAENRQLRDGTIADAFLIKESYIPPDQMPDGFKRNPGFDKMIRTMMTGSRGTKGLVKAVGNEVVITFSQRPDVLNAAVAAAGGGENLAQYGVIKAMSSWLIDDPDMTIFIDIGQIGKLVNQVSSMIPGLGDSMFKMPPGLEPVGMAMDIDGGAMRFSMVLPSSILGLILDQAMTGGDFQDMFRGMGFPEQRSPG
ncbi:MAG: hypothetical protein CMJ32_05640 [Phycisphaerae bacterium]|nr:hypothetical protein [Phycisphaerae bacterium]